MSATTSTTNGKATVTLAGTGKFRPKMAKATACADDLRPALQAGYIFHTSARHALGEGQWLAASNSYLAAWVPLQGRRVNEGAVAPEALRLLHKHGEAEVREDGSMVFPGKLGELTVAAPGAVAEGQFPTKIQTLLADQGPDLEDSDHVFTVGLDPTLLMALAEALGWGGKGIKLSFDTRNNLKAMLVETIHSGGAKGLLMPVRTQVP